MRTPFLPEGPLTVGKSVKKVLRITAIMVGLLAGEMHIADTIESFWL